MPSASISAALPRSTSRPPTVPRTPLPGTAREILGLARRRGFARARPRRSPRRADARCRPRSAAAMARSVVRGRSPAAPRRAVSLGLPSVSVPVLSTTMVSTVAMPLQRLGVADEDAGLGAAAGRDHDRDRRGEAERAGAGDDEDADGGDQRIGERRRGPKTNQTTKATTATTITAGTNHAETRSARPWIGARERCASATSATMRASVVSAPVRSTFMSKLPVPLSVPPVTASPGRLLDRHRLAGEQRLVDGAPPVDDDAVDRHLVAGADAEDVADRDVAERHLGRWRRRRRSERRLRRAGRGARGWRRRSARGRAAPAPGRGGRAR